MGIVGTMYVMDDNWALLIKKNVTNYMGVSVNTMADFQSATHACSFYTKTGLDVVLIQSFSV